MHAEDVLKYGHQTLFKALEGISEDDWYTSGLLGIWSLKDVVAHVASHEQVFVEVLGTLIGGAPTPTLDQFKSNPAHFNDDEVARRINFSREEVLSEYQDANARSIQLIIQIPVERRRLQGMLPWYGVEYDLEDYIAYGVYGHKREHSAQIEMYKDKLSNKQPGLVQSE